MTNTLEKIMHNGDEYKFPGIPNDTTGTTSIVSNIWAGTSSEYNLITPKEGQLSIVLHEEGGGGWQPTANTIGWWKLNGDTKDYSGNGYDGNSWSSYTTLSSGIKVASFDGSSYITTGYTAAPTAPFTFIAWIRRGAIDSEVYFGGKGQGSYGKGLHEGFYGNNQLVWAFYGDSNPNYYVTDTTDFHLFVGTYNGTTKKAYWDNTLVYTDTFTGYNGFPNAYTIGGRTFGGGNYIGDISSVIIEDKERTAQDVADFWNLTKADYGL